MNEVSPTTPRRPRTLRRTVHIVLIVVICAGGWWMVRPSSPLERARRIASTLQLDVSLPSCDWVSSHELFVWSYREGKLGEPAIVDIDTGNIAPLRELGARIRDLAAPKWGWAFYPSPTNRWLLAVEGQGTGKACLLSFDGRIVQPATVPGNLQVWLPDGSAYVNEQGDDVPGRLSWILHPVVAGAPPSTITLVPKGDPPVPWLATFGAASFTPASDNRLFTIYGQGIPASVPPSAGTRMVVAEVDLSRRPAPVSFHAIAVPDERATWLPQVSPDGRRVALVGEYASFPARTLFDRIRARLFPASIVAAYGEIVVTDIAGKNPRIVGTFDHQVGASAIHNLRWAPDGKRLVFERDTALWIMPAE